jgi:hypothetical protein
MHFRGSLAALAVTLALGLSAQAEDLNLSCAGPFGSDTTRARLVEAFGATNVVDKVEPGPKGYPPNVTTIIYPKDKTRRIEVMWNDNVGRTNPFSFIFTAPSRWQAPLGLRVDMGLDEVERINGKPFTIGGFGGLIDGMSYFSGGALETVAGGCGITVIMAPSRKLPKAKMDRISGDDQIPSTDATMRAARPTVWQIQVTYQPNQTKPPAAKNAQP